MNLENIQTILKSNPSESLKALEEFITEASGLFEFPELNKNDLRLKLWEAIYNLIDNSTNNILIANCFSALRILSREKVSLNEMINEDWITLFNRHCGFSSVDHKFTVDNTIVAIEAEKCLCNVVFQSSVAVTLLRNQKIPEVICQRINRYKLDTFPEEVKLYDMKLLFILTAKCSEIRAKLRDEHDAFANLLQALELNLEKSEKKNLNGEVYILKDIQVDLACDILKSVFNVTLNMDPETEKEIFLLGKMIEISRKYLVASDCEARKKVNLQSNFINLFTNIPNSYYEFLAPKLKNDEKVDEKEMNFDEYDFEIIRIVTQFLEERLSTETRNQLELLSPVLTVLYKGACGVRIIRKYLRSQILPPLKDVRTRPEEGDSLRNHLCRLLTTPVTAVRDLAAELLFVLCKRNVSRMIKYTGYGNAANLFAQKGLLSGRRNKDVECFDSESEDSETEEYAEHKHGINPVIGCYEEPREHPMANMTEEQKEYEAMKLVELMDSLTKSGPIKPCTVGADGKPEAIQHVLQLQEGLKQQKRCDSDSD